MDRIILPRKIDAVIASFGGVGTTFLLSFAAQYMKLNHPHDGDGLKHSPLPPININPNLKFVYIYGNPQLAAISLFRRNIHHYQSIKLQKWGKKKISPIPEDMTLQEYAAQGVDGFLFRNHFHNWYDRYLPACPTMFIRYETIYDNLATLLNFLDLPKKCIDKFPKRIKRNSDFAEISIETRKQLDDMYGDFSDELGRLDDIEIRRKKSYGNFSIEYLTPPYIKAVARQASQESKGFFNKLYSKIHGAPKVKE